MISLKTSTSVVRSLAVLFATVILMLFFACDTVTAAHKNDEIIVRYKDSKQSVLATADSIAGTHVEKTIDQIELQKVRLPKGLSVEEAIKLYKENPAVEYVGPNHIVSVCLEPNDVYFRYQYQWGLYSTSYPTAGIDAPSAWGITTGSSNIIIAIVDTGVYKNHQDLQSKLVQGRNVLDGASDPDDTNDDFGHGTIVAGIAAASTNNSIGMAGVSWGAEIMPIKMMDSQGNGTETEVAEGIIWAADHGAKIINMSFGGDDEMPVVQTAVEYAYNKGCLLVAAAGNSGTATPLFPAPYDQVIAVGGSDENGDRCYWSNYGTHLDVMAPGNNILSTIMNANTGSYYYISGTSVATPFVSGLAALIWTVHPSWSNGQVAAQIQTTCRDMQSAGWDEYTGWGLINAYHALVDPPLPTRAIGELSGLPDGTIVSVANAVVTSDSTTFVDRMYVEQSDRASAIMLPFTVVPTGYAEGDVVDVVGTLGTQNGERTIKGASLVKTGSQSPLSPVAMPTKTVGGGTLQFKPGVTGGAGANNVSLLVAVCGRVTATGSTYFYVDDGSKLEDGSGFTGIKVICENLTIPAENSYVRVMGISSVETSVRVIRVRKQTDVQLLP
ncbi:MAG: S8 family peptidase [Armatimonadota bacterium]|nr:S8 family peptidase [bacterium]